MCGRDNYIPARARKLLGPKNGKNGLKSSESLLVRSSFLKFRNTDLAFEFHTLFLRRLHILA